MMACMAMALCVSCKKDDPSSGGDSECSGSIEGYYYVDLGLPSGTLWATCNIGAFSPYENGSYFAWGETVPKDNGFYDWTNYKWSTGDDGHYTKYNPDDNKTVLDPEDDAARVNWGGGWRMPTRDEMVELTEKCQWKWVWMIKSFLITGPNGNSIILPAAGYIHGGGHYHVNEECRYWSNTLIPKSIDDAYFLCGEYRHVDVTTGCRYFGRSVRPVCSPQDYR